MNAGEILSLVSNKIYQDCLATFKEYGIPPTLATFALDRVYRLVQESTVNETVNNLSKTAFDYEELKASLEEGEKEDGDTTSEGFVQ